MTTLIIGGTTGLGLELAKQLTANGDSVIVTGRKEIKEDIKFQKFDLSQVNLAGSIEGFVSELPVIERLMYAAGYFQEGRVTDLSESEIEEMISVGARGLIYFVRALLQKQGELQ